MSEEEILQYFVSVPMYYAWVLLYTDGETRIDLLGINCIHYLKKDRAKQWFINMKSNLNKLEDEDIYNRAMKELRILYSYMDPKLIK